MNVLVFNCGSSSLKYKLIELPSETERAGGEAQRVGPPTAEPSRIVHHAGDLRRVVAADMPDHAAAFDRVMRLLAETTGRNPDAFGHRLVHGGPRFSDHAVIDEAALAGLREVQDLAPLHNPPAVRLIEACRRAYPHVPQVAVFDTVFHATIPDHARTYALPDRLRREYGLRKYGFHGISHAYVAGEAARFLGRPAERLNAVSCHLGSGGASLCAVVGGVSVDNTMGYSPLPGLLMSTRCGDLDPAVTLRLLAARQGDVEGLERLLNRESGVLGVSGESADIRDVIKALGQAGQTDARRELTAELYLWRIRKYLGSYLAVTYPTDVIIFTDTIGEEMPVVRRAVCADLECFGVVLDPVRNEAPPTYPADVSARRSAVRILVIRTNEELAIAREAYRRLSPVGVAGGTR